MKEPESSLEEKIDFLIQKVERIERTVNPPFWKKVLHWLWNHLLTILLLVIVTFVVWQIWTKVQAIIIEANQIKTQVGIFADQMNELKSQVGQNLEALKFWK